MPRPNMSHVMIVNTKDALSQVNEEIFVDEDDLSVAELEAAIGLLRECAKFINHHGEDVLGFADGAGLTKLAKSAQESVRSLLGEESLGEVI